MPAKSKKSPDIADDLKALASACHAIRKQIEVESEDLKILQLQSQIKDKFSMQWQGTEFADFCAQTLTMTNLIAVLLKMEDPAKLDFLQINRTFARVPSINAIIAKMVTLVRSWTPQRQDLDASPLELEDQITRYYELFLGVYDKRARDSLGTFYTPPPVVDFIVRTVEGLLSSFGGYDCMWSGAIDFLDPASGTNVFLSRALHYYLKRYCPPGSSRLPFPRAFLEKYETHEIQSTPYCLGALNVLSLLQSAWSEEVSQGIPWKCRMWDTLEHFGEEYNNDGGEADPVPRPLVIWGNPPYKKDAKTGSPGLADAMKRYQDPVRFEKSLRVLSDYYVKFLRYAHERVLHAGQGIIALVLNSSYIDGPVHRGLRASLIQDFSEIYVVNLHGAIQPPEITPPDVTDENVFDIRTGVSILFLKRTGTKATPCQTIRYWDCWGTRNKKFEALGKNDLSSGRWKVLPANHWGITYNQFSLAGLPPTLIETYARGISIRNIFKTMVMGVTTGKDDVLVAFTREELLRQIMDARSTLQLPERMMGERIKDSIIPYNYRPLDFRYIFYVQGVVNRDRREVMKYLAGEQQVPGNVAIVTERFIRATKAPQWNFIYATDIVPDKSCISNQDNSHVYPLYFGSVKGQQDNIHKDVLTFLSKAYGIPILPAQVFDYILGLLSTPKFQSTFSPLLGLDYPVILFPREGTIFTKMAALGSQLRISFILSEDSPRTYFHVVDAAKSLRYVISEVRFDLGEERLWYAPDEYVGIPQRVWDWFIGYFHPIEHYFSDREGRKLTSEEVANVNRAITSLIQITQISQDLDAVYENILNFLDCQVLLKNIIQNIVHRSKSLPIPGLSPSGAEIARVRKILYLPDERIIGEALK